MSDQEHQAGTHRVASNEQETYECDALVVGSGCAGMAAAVTAGHHGLNVLIVEKEPRFVDITARSCELTFKGAKQTITGRRASEIFATEAMAGVPPDGAAGSVFESLSKLNCTLDPAEIRQKAGGGASCSFDTGN
jgi:hypothetical protein